MPRSRTAVEAAAGQLILAVQKEWGAEIGTPAAEMSESVIDRAHTLLQAAKTGSLQLALGRQGVAGFLGEPWVSSHPTVQPAIQTLEALLRDGQHA